MASPPTSRNLAEQSRDMVKRTLADTSTMLREMQEGPPGTIPRSTRERNVLWKKLLSLERPEKQAILEAMAERAGHTTDEDKPCELCRFLMEHMDTGK